MCHPLFLVMRPPHFYKFVFASLTFLQAYSWHVDITTSSAVIEINIFQMIGALLLCLINPHCLAVFVIKFLDVQHTGSIEQVTAISVSTAWIILIELTLFASVLIIAFTVIGAVNN